ncbi:MAG: XRE family transcriptional regulator [Candidatus Zambryskibacteria bacterium]|nr:XRE family transcriptional regulator [Candidatus Zambryskibacteria bacterium]
MKIDPKELADFLEEANKSTYANKDAPKATSSRPKSEDYHFKKGNLIYHDTYFGGRDFIGGEIVYKENIPVWGMNYYGYVLNPEVSEKDVYSFLRKALMQEYSDIIPVRGAGSYENDGWQYRNTPEGNLERFTGVEEIYRQKELVYRAHYHGGSIE